MKEDLLKRHETAKKAKEDHEYALRNLKTLKLPKRPTKSSVSPTKVEKGGTKPGDEKLVKIRQSQATSSMEDGSSV